MTDAKCSKGKAKSIEERALGRACWALGTSVLGAKASALVLAEIGVGPRMQGNDGGVVC